MFLRHTRRNLWLLLLLSVLPLTSLPTAQAQEEVDEQAARKAVFLPFMLGTRGGIVLADDLPADAVSALATEWERPFEEQAAIANDAMAASALIESDPTLLPAEDLSLPPLSDNGEVSIASGRATVVLQPRPSVRVGRGRNIAYDLRIINDGDADLSQVRIRLPYDPSKLILLGSRFERRSGDWVSRVTDSEVTITTGAIKAGRNRVATINFRVRPGLPTETVISTRANFEWRGGKMNTNFAPVVVGGGDVHSTVLGFAVEPDRGRRGTLHRFFTDRFLPNEDVVFWLNVGRKTRALDIRARTDDQGRVTIEFRSNDLTPGAYGMVAYGLRSRMTAVRGFIVDR